MDMDLAEKVITAEPQRALSKREEKSSSLKLIGTSPQKIFKEFLGDSSAFSAALRLSLRSLCPLSTQPS